MKESGHHKWADGRLARMPVDPHLKRRYNLCHRLRLQGIQVDTVGNAINIATWEAYDALTKTTRRHVDTLRDEYHFVIQTYIPAAEEKNPAVKFRRRRKT